MRMEPIRISAPSAFLGPRPSRVTLVARRCNCTPDSFVPQKYNALLMFRHVQTKSIGIH